MERTGTSRSCPRRVVERGVNDRSRMADRRTCAGFGCDSNHCLHKNQENET